MRHPVAYAYSGKAGKRLRVEAFLAQKLVARHAALADALADMAEPTEVAAGTALIEENALVSVIGAMRARGA